MTYREYDEAGERPPAEHTVTARRLIVAAGTLGSTYLLLRNRAGLRRLSPALGTRFSGNGDLLTFLRNSRRPVDPECGPVITSAIRVGDELDGDGDRGRGFYVEDGGNPQFLDWLVELSGVIARERQFH